MASGVTVHYSSLVHYTKKFPDVEHITKFELQNDNRESIQMHDNNSEQLTINVAHKKRKY